MMIHRLIIGALALSLAAGGTPATAGYGYGGYAQSYYPPVYNYYNTYPIRERVIVEHAVPAYVFQVVAPGLVPAVVPRPVAAPVVQAPAPMPPKPAMPMPAADVERIAELVARRLGAGAVPEEDVPPMLDDAAVGLPATPPSGAQPLLSQATLSALGTSCYRCHAAAGIRTGVPPKGGVILFNEQDQWAPRRTDGTALERGEVYEAVQSGRMPKGAGAAKLPADAVAALKVWSGAP